MVELWDRTGTTVLNVISGKRSYLPDHACGRALGELPGAPHLCPIAGGLGIDNAGSVLVSVFLGVNDVIRFPTRAHSGVDSSAAQTSASSTRRVTPTSRIRQAYTPPEVSRCGRTNS